MVCGGKKDSQHSPQNVTVPDCDWNRCTLSAWLHLVLPSSLLLCDASNVWERDLEDVIGKLAELQCAEIEREWKHRKHKMEKVSRWPWTATGSSQTAVQLREYTLREFWDIFVDDRPFGAKALFRHVNVQSKTVFSYIYTKEALSNEQIPNPATEEYLKKRMLSIMLCTKWGLCWNFRGSRAGVRKCNVPHMKQRFQSENSYDKEKNENRWPLSGVGRTKGSRRDKYDTVVLETTDEPQRQRISQTRRSEARPHKQQTTLLQTTVMRLPSTYREPMITKWRNAG